MDNKTKCKYCDCKPNKEPFSNDDVVRGELIADDCDVDAFIKYDEKNNDYELTLISYDYPKGGIDCEIKYCPFCGRKLNNNKGNWD